MLYLKTGEYKIGVIPPFLDELKAAVIRWLIACLAVIFAK